MQIIAGFLVWACLPPRIRTTPQRIREQYTPGANDSKYGINGSEAPGASRRD